MRARCHACQGHAHLSNARAGPRADSERARRGNRESDPLPPSHAPCGQRLLHKDDWRRVHFLDPARKRRDRTRARKPVLTPAEASVARLCRGSGAPCARGRVSTQGFCV